MNYNINDLNKYKIIPERITAYLIDFLILTPILAISIVMFATTSSVIIINTWSFASFFFNIFFFYIFYFFIWANSRKNANEHCNSQWRRKIAIASTVNS